MSVLGIDLGCSSTKWVLLEGHRVVDEGARPTPPDEWATADMLVELGRRHSADAVGIGVPGHVDRDRGVVRFLTNMPGSWTDLPLGPRLAEQLGRPVLVLNDARAFAVAELTLGAARGTADALFLTLGTGVGGGIASGGQVLVGPDDRLGEIGHLTYHRDGPACGCGNHGCLETFAGALGIVRAARTRLHAGEKSALTEATLDVAAVFGAAAHGDPVASEVVAVTGDAIGSVLSEVAALLPVGLVVIGGGVALIGFDALRPHIEAALARRADFIGKIAVVPAALGHPAGALGAALSAAEAADTTATTETTGGRA